MTPERARELMHQWTESQALRVHMECVAACMGAYADRLDPGARGRWVACGLLHDFDYEKHPTEREHPYVGVEHLRSLGVEEEITTAILGHAEYTQTPRQTPMARALFAVDELAGFLVACAKVRPDGIASLTPKSVKKKLKDKSFAAAVSRRDIETGFKELSPLMGEGFDQTAHIQACIDAIRAEANRLGV